MNIYFGFKEKERKQARKFVGRGFFFNNVVIKICISETTLPPSG